MNFIIEVSYWYFFNIFILIYIAIIIFIKNFLNQLLNTVTVYFLKLKDYFYLLQLTQGKNYLKID